MYDYQRIEYLNEEDFEIFLTAYLNLVTSKSLSKMAEEANTTPHNMLIDILQLEIDERRTEHQKGLLGV